MPRDFRPKGARRGGAGGESSGNGRHSSMDTTKFSFREKRKPSTSSGRGTDDGEGDAEDDTALLQTIRQLGGNEEDLKLVSALGHLAPKAKVSKGKARAKAPDEVDDVADLPKLTADLRSFMRQLDFDVPAVTTSDRPAKSAKNVVSRARGELDIKDAPLTSSSLDGTKQHGPSKSASAGKKSKATEDSTEPPRKQDDRRNDEQHENTKRSRAKAQLPAARQEALKGGKWREDRAVRRQSTHAAKKSVTDQEALNSSAKAVSKDGKAQAVSTELLLPAIPRWHDAYGSLLSLESHTEPPPFPSEERITALHAVGRALLEQEGAAYDSLSDQGKGGIGIGTLSAADARFVRSLLTGTSATDTSSSKTGGGTVADRISALTLLLQSSPVHNLRSLDALLAMCGKKAREEAGRATRAMADWLASDGGLGKRKLRYFRDQPALPRLAAQKEIDSACKSHLCLYAFEDFLKDRYYNFLQSLEAQTQDTLPFVRKQALGHVFGLLRDAPEQEANLLRLLSNKLGDTERSVSAKASRLLLELLTTHPAMKTVVTREVANLVLRPPQVFSNPQGQKKTKHNQHARYYGVLTLNQTMLTAKDTEVANRLVGLYFDLFESVLIEEQGASHGHEELPVIEAGEATPEIKKTRWRDNGGSGSKKQSSKNTAADHVPQEDANAKMTAAILAGVRRAFPFANIDEDIFDKHISTIFRITHSGIFNISIQALQLIFQIISTSRISKLSQSASTAITDRFYRTLYSSLLDERLGSTSKQAMYLNLVYKALKNDDDFNRVKAFVKRLAQIMANHQAPFVCGALFMLGQLFESIPGLRTMLSEPEDDGEEHFVDAPEEGLTSARPSSGSPQSLHKLDGPAAGTGVTSLYDGKKREPRYAHAERTCLWELVSLQAHFHPTVSLLAKQLVTSQPLTSHADLSLHTLSHFLDRFVFRNPKKAAPRGVSAMQPALPVVAGVAADPDAPVVMTRGGGMAEDEYVNESKFWRKKAGDVPVDQLFFHRYFNQKLERQGAARRLVRSKGDVESDQEDAAASSDGDVKSADGSEIEIEGEDDFSDVGSGDEDPMSKQDIGVESGSDEGEDEKEIWKAMKQSMPRADGDEDLMEESDEQDDEMVEYSDSDADEQNLANEGGFASDQESILEDEDEDDLLPFPSFEDGEPDGKKRSHSDLDGDNESSSGANKVRNKESRELKRRRKALPIFASADEYAHLIGASDDEI